MQPQTKHTNTYKTHSQIHTQHMSVECVCEPVSEAHMLYECVVYVCERGTHVLKLFFPDFFLALFFFHHSCFLLDCFHNKIWTNYNNQDTAGIHFYTSPSNGQKHVTFNITLTTCTMSKPMCYKIEMDS